jgi:hypothetical protein
MITIALGESEGPAASQSWLFVGHHAAFGLCGACRQCGKVATMLFHPPRSSRNGTLRPTCSRTPASHRCRSRRTASMGPMSREWGWCVVLWIYLHILQKTRGRRAADMTARGWRYLPTLGLATACGRRALGNGNPHSGRHHRPTHCPALHGVLS